MTKQTDFPSDDEAANLLRFELDKALALGISKRSPEQIHAEARERSIIAGIERGLADMKAGNNVPHDVAMAEVDALIDEPGGLR